MMEVCLVLYNYFDRMISVSFSSIVLSNTFTIGIMTFVFYGGGGGADNFCVANRINCYSNKNDFNDDNYPKNYRVKLGLERKEF